ncbi:MAG: IPT/TIG domain-containing protein [Patescibacteria group bacterium]
MNTNKIFTFLSVFVFVFSTAFVTQAESVAPTSSCIQLSNDLHLGLSDVRTDGEVTKLQSYLSTTGYFHVVTTGYFGVVTMDAVRNFQRDHGIITTGFVGPLTRAEIGRISCGTVTNNLQIYSLSPQSGVVGTEVLITGSDFTTDNTILFGNGALVHAKAWDNGTKVSFIVPDYLSPLCYYSNPPCLTFAASQKTTPGDYSVQVKNANGTSNNLNFTVTSQNTLNPYIDSITPAQGSTGTVVTLFGSGFANTNIIKFGNGAIYNGEVSQNGTRLTFTVPKYIGNYCAPNMFCSMLARQVTPGDYVVSIKNVDTAESNSKVFTVISDSNNGPQIIGIDAPNSLRVGEQGTWVIQTAAQAIGTYSYSVVWGDEINNSNATVASNASTVFQTTTFTHTYNSPGTYTPRFIVTNSGKASASVSSTVIVTNN